MDSYSTGPDAGTIVVVALVYLLIFAGLYVWTALALNAVFRKVGEPAWGGWVPYFNWALLLKLGGFSPYLIFIILFPYLGALAVWVLFIIAAHRINNAFGYREGAGIGMTILAALLMPVWASVLGWGSARWVGPDPRLRAAAMGAAPGAGFAPGYAAQPGYPSQSGYAAQPGQAAAQPSYGAPTWPTTAPGAHVPPAAPAGYVPPAAPEGYTPPAPPAAPAGYVPPAASAGYAPPTAANPFAPADEMTDATDVSFAPGPKRAAPAPADEDFEGVDDPIPGSAPAPDATGPQSSPPEAAAVIDSVPGSATADAPAAPPVESPAATPAVPVDDPWAPPVEPPAARRSPMPEEPAGFSDTSAEVSAVAGAPRAGSPMAARSSVSALRDEPELPDAESAFDETIIAPRKRTEWMLTPPLGAPIRITAPVLILGRRPAADPAYPQAQLIDFADETRTVSKTHARLELAAGQWTVTDLDSTNGVVLVAADGSETEVPAGGSQLVGERFQLGDAELRLTRGQD